MHPRAPRDKRGARVSHKDAPALMGLRGCCDTEQFLGMLQRLTELVEDGILRFPRAVMKDLQVVAKGEPITAWVIGLGKSLRLFSVDYEYKLAVMQMIQDEFQYDAGLEDMNGGDPAIIELAATGHMFESLNLDFWIVSEDRGTAPLRPTMEQICQLRNWPMVGACDGLKSLGEVVALPALGAAPRSRARVALVTDDLLHNAFVPDGVARLGRDALGGEPSGDGAQRVARDRAIATT